MKSKLPVHEQKNFFRPILIKIINVNYELLILVEKMEWKSFEIEFGWKNRSAGPPCADLY